MLEKLTIRKKWSILLFLIFLIRRVYVCLTADSCKGCEYKQMCDDESLFLCSLVTNVAYRVREYMLAKEM